MYVKQLNAYTVAQLKEELTNRNLETTGKKAELVVRLAGFLEGKHRRQNRSLYARVQRNSFRDLVTNCLSYTCGRDERL